MSTPYAVYYASLDRKTWIFTAAYGSIADANRRADQISERSGRFVKVTCESRHGDHAVS